MNTRWTELAAVSSVFLRLALGISFLSAVADRFGLWGVFEQPNVAWGNYARFVAYTPADASSISLENRPSFDSLPVHSNRRCSRSRKKVTVGIHRFATA